MILFILRKVRWRSLRVTWRSGWPHVYGKTRRGNIFHFKTTKSKERFAPWIYEGSYQVVHQRHEEAQGL